jgi:DeoR family transcriptional regulator, fructose operon transcriptional repressor
MFVRTNNEHQDNPMSQEERFKYILENLDAHNYISVSDLSLKFEVSQMTIRRDLTDLEGRGLLKRKHGGAVSSEAIPSIFSFDKRLEKNKTNKEYICSLASRFIEDGDVIFIDCGTTLCHISKYVINKNNVRIITASLPVVSELIHYPHIRITLIGGDIIHERRATYGPLIGDVIDKYHADKAFIGADGVSLQKGTTSYDEKEAQVTNGMARNAGKVYLLCDSSKLERDSFYTCTPLEGVDTIITDMEINSETLELYSSNNTKILTE